MVIRNNCLASFRASGRFHDCSSGEESQLLPDPAYRGSPGGLLSLSLINRYVQVIMHYQTDPVCSLFEVSIMCITTLFIYTEFSDSCDIFFSTNCCVYSVVLFCNQRS